jgi:hypothetical protein
MVDRKSVFNPDFLLYSGSLFSSIYSSTNKYRLGYSVLESDNTSPSRGQHTFRLRKCHSPALSHSLSERLL